MLQGEIPVITKKKLMITDVSKVPGENPLETMKEAVASRAKKKFKDLMGHGFELTSEYKDGIFYIRAIPLITQKSILIN